MGLDTSVPHSLLPRRAQLLIGPSCPSYRRMQRGAYPCRPDAESPEGGARRRGWGRDGELTGHGWKATKFLLDGGTFFTPSFGQAYKEVLSLSWPMLGGDVTWRKRGP